MTPLPWQGTSHEAAALAQIAPAALQTPFQQVMHRTGSLPEEATKEVKYHRRYLMTTAQQCLSSCLYGLEGTSCTWHA